MSQTFRPELRPDLAIIAAEIPQGARVLDIGCGDGALMANLRERQSVDAPIDVRGMEINPALVEKCVARGLSVVQGDADRDLAEYPDKSFDVAILSQTLQTAARPDLMLKELLRVGGEAFVSFPNFGHWRMRRDLMLRGRMPVTRHLPVSWYETQNIHHMTVADFRELVADLGVTEVASWFFASEREITGGGANWRAEYAVFRLRG